MPHINRLLNATWGNINNGFLYDIPGTELLFDNLNAFRFTCTIRLTSDVSIQNFTTPLATLGNYLLETQCVSTTFIFFITLHVE